MWATGDPAFHELNDVLQYLGAFTFRDPVPAYRHDAAMWFELRGWAATDATPLGALRRPDADRDVLWTLAERLDALDGAVSRARRPLPAGEEARGRSTRCAPASRSSASTPTSRSPTPSMPPDRSRTPVTVHRRRRRHAHRAQPLRRPPDGGLGRHRRPARPPTSCGAGGTASRASGCGLVWGEATAVRPDGRANPHQLVLDATHRRRASPRCAPASIPRRSPGSSSRTRAAGADPTATPAPRTAYAHPLLDARVGADAATPFTDAELDDARGRLRRRRRCSPPTPASTSST